MQPLCITVKQWLLWCVELTHSSLRSSWVMSQYTTENHWLTLTYSTDGWVAEWVRQLESSDSCCCEFKSHWRLLYFLLKLFDVNFVQKCQICIENEKPDYLHCQLTFHTHTWMMWLFKENYTNFPILTYRSNLSSTGKWYNNSWMDTYGSVHRSKTWTYWRVFRENQRKRTKFVNFFHLWCSFNFVNSPII